MRASPAQVVEEHELSVFRAAFYVCKNRQDAEDVCQETFLAYMNSRREFDSPEHLKAWLLRVAINKARNVCRAFWRRNRESLEDYAEAMAAAPPEDGELLQAVLSLPGRCREIIHLYYYEDYSVKEIAELLQIGEGTVKSQLHRGRELLREKLREGWNDE